MLCFLQPQEPRRDPGAQLYTEKSTHGGAVMGTMGTTGQPQDIMECIYVCMYIYITYLFTYLFIYLFIYLHAAYGGL